MIVDVQPAEYFRLLGYPRDHMPKGRACELAEAAREWYAVHGRPWVHTAAKPRSRAALRTSSPAGVCGRRSRKRRRTRRFWSRSVPVPKPKRKRRSFGARRSPTNISSWKCSRSAVVEQLITTTGAQLCAWAEAQGMAVLPHYSPGYSEWDIAEQGRLMALLGELPGRLRCFDSGGAAAEEIAARGLRTDAARRVPAPAYRPSAVRDCSFGPCQYRRAPYRRDRPGLAELPRASPVSYSTNPKALKRWAAERLKLGTGADGVRGRAFPL